jgi:excisionase family DNA binding protein
MPELARFVRVDEAARRTGLSERAIDRRIYAGEIEAFRDPVDRRHRLVKLEDLDRLTNVVPFGQDRAAAEQRAG